MAAGIETIERAATLDQHAAGRPANRAGGRMMWLDAAKGMGIIAVVIGHAIGGLIDSPARLDLAGFREVFLAIYIFHMPLFFLLAGLLVRKRLARGHGRFLADIGRSVVYPYFLWSIIQFTVIYLAGSLVNHPVDVYWRVIVQLPWLTISQFWFLYVLFVLHMAALAIVPRFGAWFLLGLAIAAKAALPFVDMPDMLRLSANQAPYYALGVLLGAHGVARGVGLAPRWFRDGYLPVAALLALMLTSALIIAARPAFAGLASPDIAAIAWRLGSIPAALLAVAAVLALAHRWRGRALDLFAWLGRASMAIFILHILFIAGTRIIATRLLGIDDPLLILLLICVVGIAGPLVCRTIAQRLGIETLLGLR